MRLFLAPLLRRLFQPQPIGRHAAPAAPPAEGVIGTSSMDLPTHKTREKDDEGAEFSAAVDLHESVNAMEREAYESRLHRTMDELFKRLDTRKNG